MNNKRNVIVMFLFVMLSFAIVSQVSAVSDAEADGTGFDHSIESVNMTGHDIASERVDDISMQDHDMEKFESHNEQNSFNKSPEQIGDKNIENRNFYELDEKPDGMIPSNDNFTDGNAPMDMFKPDGDRPLNNSPADLRDNNFTAVPKGEAMNDIVPKLDNGTPDFKNDAKGPQPLNVTDQHGPDNKNKSAMLPDDIKNNKSIKLDKPKDMKPKAIKKVKKVKKPKAAKKAKKANKIKKPKDAKKVKNNKSNSIKKVNNKSKPVKGISNSKKNAVVKSENMKKSIKERAKL